MPDARFISIQHLPRLSKALGDGKSGREASTGLNTALQALAVDFGNPRFLARTYIQPHCQSDDPPAVAPVDDGRGTGSADRSPLFSVIDDFLSTGEQPSAHDGPPSRQMFVLGEAGTGKTSLLVMLKLMHVAALWPKHQRCELFKLGPETLDQIRNIKTPRKTVLLLDALNEDPLAAEDVHARVAELLRATAAFHRVVITCRAGEQPDGRHDPFAAIGRLARAGRNCPTIYLSPFNDSQVDKYLKRRFRRMEEPSRKRAKIVLGGMGPVGSRPLVLSVADEFVHSRCKEWSEFTVYEAMVNAWLDREQNKSTRGKGDADAGGGAFDRDVLLEACVKVARLMALAKPPSSLSPADLGAASLPAPEAAQLAALDGRGGALLLRDPAGSFRFSHPSIAEFLIALGLHRGVLHSGKKRVPATALLITFLLQGRGSAIEWRTLDLSSASLVGAHLQDSDFSRSLLAGAKLANAVFAKTSFDNADLKSSEARGAKFVECNFKATNSANASAASAVFDRCQFTQASFAGAALPGASFEGCSIENTSFADSDLSGAVFNKCNIAHGNFTSANLAGASFRDCTLDGLKFDRCSLNSTAFSNTRPTDLSLLATDLRRAELDESFLAAAKSGAFKNGQDAAWDPEIAKRLRFSSNGNAQNAAAIDGDSSR